MKGSVKVASRDRRGAHLRAHGVWSGVMRYYHIRRLSGWLLSWYFMIVVRLLFIGGSFAVVSN